MKDSQLDPLHGITVDHDIDLDWECIGTLDKDYGSAKQVSGDVTGVYAFVLENKCVLYIGKAGGLKPDQKDRWAQGIQRRVDQHWKSGPFRGLVRATGAKIQVWILDARKSLKKIWERDIERIENEIINWFKKGNKNNLPGNIACEGTSQRKFIVHIESGKPGPLPRVILKPGISVDNRRGRNRSNSK